jgi:17beta-estradiol 17-dehydrogenase / very-long-chain 3-oxoacyl-CoA reductase
MSGLESLLHGADRRLVGGLALLGAVVVARYAVLLLARAARALRSARSPRSYGPWVVVTGATDGIGRALCFEFAKKGMNVMLMSRTESKLAETAKEVSASVGGSVQTKWLSVDFSRFDKPAQERVAKELAQLGGVGILVNNVGMSYPFPLYFHELSEEEVRGLLELNINATTWMTRVVLPLMLAQKKGLILNIGSAAGLHPSPLLALYSATKAYVETLSHSLSTEYKSKGIDVQAHMPLFVVSKLSKYKKPSGFVPSAETYAKETMATLGLDPVVSPHFQHRVANFIMDSVPESLVQYLSLQFHLGIRAKGLKKREAEAAAK